MTMPAGQSLSISKPLMFRETIEFKIQWGQRCCDLSHVRTPTILFHSQESPGPLMTLMCELEIPERHCKAGCCE